MFLPLLVYPPTTSWLPKKLIDDGHFYYMPVSGIALLCQAIADKLKRGNQLEYSTDQIVVLTGAKQTIENVMLSIIDKC
ncbi:aminotransferase class I/II-fold pyridoxal phosphate-dependent enzyme [Bernardetia sp. MNP-M8]|uniref:aminotransferase class I/II-fold pyridoxal phosphate-dependent enzyme n=1 Tax=Bernardetia sp. MNP-M8 TaxID=3127470 RepID=UPI0030D1FFB6